MIKDKDLLKEFKYYVWEDEIIPGKELSKAYLEKCWLSDEELKNKWQPIKDNIFNKDFVLLPDKNDHEFRDQVFSEGFILRPVLGGGLFDADHLEALKKCMQVTGDKYFAVIEDLRKEKEPRYSESGLKIPRLKFRYPVSINFPQLTFGNGAVEGITNELFSPVRNYYVFGDSGKWGKYTANDADEAMGVDIMGFTPEYLDLFREHFPTPDEEERKDLEAPLPKHYVERIIW